MRGEEDIYDIGPETAKFFAGIIKDSQTIFFNGPMGLFEKREFSGGTQAIVEAIARAHGAYRVAGGGQTLEAIHKYKVQNCFNFLSTGGGAMLEYLAGNVLPGIAALEKNNLVQKAMPQSAKAPAPKK
jgi:phosphoglycerate kinase